SFYVVISRRDDDQVHPRGFNLILDRGLRSTAERDHREHGGHADRQPDHRQSRLQLVLRQRSYRDLEAGPGRHQAALPSANAASQSSPGAPRTPQASAVGSSGPMIGWPPAPAAVRSSRASLRFSLASSETIWPSLIVTTRDPYSATCGSCVISTTV